ncbi:helix-turn-helix domain-containing protein [Tautonia plasticadhaerens]|uniref:helix-turn-helix domain-containing protein n=1 Tax=Tautonia plasticadhaerens TaxID=2527974 RepID=UPI0011A28815
MNDIVPDGSRGTSPWLTPDEAAAYLRVAPGTIRNWTSAGYIPFSRRGRVVRYHREALDRWLSRGSCPGRSSIAEAGPPGEQYNHDPRPRVLRYSPGLLQATGRARTSVAPGASDSSRLHSHIHRDPRPRRTAVPPPASRSTTTPTRPLTGAPR